MAKMKRIEIPENRGRRRKYHFDELKVGYAMFFPTTPQSIIVSFKAWCSRNQKNWKAKTVTHYDESTKKWGTLIQRIK